MRTIHLFAGAGGGLLGDLILGHEPVCAVEWEPYACAVLRERVVNGWFPGLHVHEGDVRLFDPSPWAGRVDCIHAGFPCQDISVAGGGAGIDGERSGLYREVLRIADVVRPQYLFLENSPAITGRGLGTVLGDLAARGYDARWTVLAAADVGAPHQRERWWCLCWRAAPRGGPNSNASNPDKARVFDHRDQHGETTGQAWPSVSYPRFMGTAADVADAYEIAGGAGGRTGSSRQSPQAWDDAAGCGQGIRDWWGTEPNVGRLADGVASRLDQLAALGNGQVPLCAAAAWRLLGGP